jgi:hypothetical protein
MPAGAHWILRYDSTVDGRIQARVDSDRLRQDEYVKSVRTLITLDSCTVDVQFDDDRGGPLDRRLFEEVASRQVIETPPEPPRATIGDLMTESIRSPFPQH